ncbi:MAG: NUDIX domain-containing protein [Nitrospinae bacterium]|nr:NUDIX domain-containing protein [Nitrospinota bacterium]MBL7019047.1 NUDIX domain-containing protein [Nitrospinaceae bacterium]
MNVEHEIYNIVDENDCITGQASRKNIHQNKLLHRSAHILVFNSRRELFLQKRALCKDESPGLWDTSAAGHVDAGESYDACAHRELFEELHLKAVLKPSMKISACQETHEEHVQVYTCTTDETIQVNSEEISEGAFFGLAQIQKNISANPAQFTSSFKLLFNQTLNNENIS